jgi:hypothetical protein
MGWAHVHINEGIPARWRFKEAPTAAALLPGYAVLFTHERVVSIDLASKS